MPNESIHQAEFGKSHDLMGMYETKSWGEKQVIPFVGRVSKIEKAK
jgi:hypothetical protein